MSNQRYLTLCTAHNIQKCVGTNIETVVLRQPHFIRWARQQPNAADWRQFHQHVVNSANAFDAKALVNEQCQGCTVRPTRFALYPQSASVTFWCDNCDPMEIAHGGIPSGVYDTYLEALNHSLTLTRLQCARMIRSIANAKGLIGRFTEGKIAKFLYADTVDGCEQ